MSDNDLTVDKFEELEGKVISAAKNDPEGPFKVLGTEVTFRRPRLFDKYKGRVWANRKLKSIGIDDLEAEEQGLVFYYRFIGGLCMNVHTIRVDGKLVTLESGDEYEFVLEKYLEEYINARGLSEEPYMDELSAAYASWESGTPTEDEVKKS